MIPELLLYGTILSTAFLISIVGVITFNRESRAEFIQEVLR